MIGGELKKCQDMTLVGQPYRVSPGVPCRDVARYVSTWHPHPFQQRCAPKALDFARAASPLRNATI